MCNLFFFFNCCLFLKVNVSLGIRTLAHALLYVPLFASSFQNHLRVQKAQKQTDPGRLISRSNVAWKRWGLYLPYAKTDTAAKPTHCLSGSDVLPLSLTWRLKCGQMAAFVIRHKLLGGWEGENTARWTFWYYKLALPLKVAQRHLLQMELTWQWLRCARIWATSAQTALLLCDLKW